MSCSMDMHMIYDMHIISYLMCTHLSINMCFRIIKYTRINILFYYVVLFNSRINLFFLQIIFCTSMYFHLLPAFYNVLYPTLSLDNGAGTSLRLYM